MARAYRNRAAPFIFEPRKRASMSASLMRGLVVSAKIPGGLLRRKAVEISRPYRQSSRCGILAVRFESGRPGAMTSASCFVFSKSAEISRNEIDER